MIISPFSVANALALLSQATGGSTFDELKKGLHLSSNQTTIASQYSEYYKLLKDGAKNATFSIANQVFVQKGYKINKNFQEIAVQKFSSDIEFIDFVNKNAAAETINGFIKEKTNNKIKDLIKSDMLGADCRVVLVNAIYFKGDWEHKFKQQYTSKEDFYISDTDKVQVDFMYQKNEFNYGFLEDLYARALEMKYANDFSFIIVLPTCRTGLNTLENKLKNYNLTAITEQLETEDIDVYIPKFKVEFELELNNALGNVCYFGFSLHYFHIGCLKFYYLHLD